MRWWLGKGLPPPDPRTPHSILLKSTSDMCIDCFRSKGCILPDTEDPWFDPDTMPPVSLYVGGKDRLVDGRKLIQRLSEVERRVKVVRWQIDEEYEHLDCLWSMDCVERIGRNVRDDIKATIPENGGFYLR